MIDSLDFLLFFSQFGQLLHSHYTSKSSIPQIALMTNNQVIKQYYNFIRMKTKLNIQEAAGKIFQNNLQPLSNPYTEWQLFTPFLTPSDSILLLKLIEVPSNFVTSSQIINKIKDRYQSIIHPVDIFLAERDIQKTYYLARAETNLISVESFINLKKQAGEKVQQKIIIQFLQFANKLESHQFCNQITFKLDEVGMTSSGSFMLTNYKMYFVSPETQEKTDLNKDIKRMLTRLLLPNQDKLDLKSLYSYVEEEYGQKIMKVVKQCLGEQFRVSEVMTYMAENNSSMVDTTLSDSFHNEIIQNIENISTSDIPYVSDNLTLYESLIDEKPKVKSKKNKLGIAAIVFVAILIAIGAITFKYLTPKPLTCLEQQYLNKELNQCLGCDPSCGRCQGEGSLMCLNCKDTNLFLIKKNRNQKVGKCSVSCSGTMVQPKICIDNN